MYAGPHDAAITQVAHGVPSSSLSCPSIVADMLAAADLHPGQRVLATYAVDTVPWPWVAQCTPGARLVVPWGRPGTLSSPSRLTGSRPPAGLAQFMAARGVPPGRPYADVRGDGPAEDEQPFRDLSDGQASWYRAMAALRAKRRASSSRTMRPTCCSLRPSTRAALAWAPRLVVLASSHTRSRTSAA